MYRKFFSEKELAESVARNLVHGQFDVFNFVSQESFNSLVADVEYITGVKLSVYGIHGKCLTGEDNILCDRMFEYSAGCIFCREQGEAHARFIGDLFEVCSYKKTLTRFPIRIGENRVANLSTENLFISEFTDECYDIIVEKYPTAERDIDTIFDHFDIIQKTRLVSVAKQIKKMVEIFGKFQSLRLVNRDLLMEKNSLEKENVLIKKQVRTLFDNTSDAVLVVQNGIICRANQVALDKFNMSEEQLKPFNIFDFVHPDDRMMVASHHQRTLNGEKVPNSYEVRCAGDRANWEWYDVYALLSTYNGNPATLCFFKNINAEKLAAEKLRRQSCLFEQVANSPDIMIVVYDADLNYSYANTNVLDVLDCDLDTIVGFSPLNDGPLKNHKVLYNALVECRDSKRIVIVDEVVDLNKRGVCNMRFVFRPVYDGETFVGVVEHSFLLDGVRQSSAEINCSNDMFLFLAHSPEVMLIIYDAEMNYRFVSKPVCEHLQLSAKEMVGNHVNYSGWMQRTNPKVLRAIEECYETRETVVVEDSMILHDGEHWMRFVFYPYIHEGEFKGVIEQLIFIDDVYEREKEMIEARELFTFVTSKGDFEVYITDEKGVITYINSEAERTFEGVELVGKYYEDVLSPIDKDKWRHVLRTQEKITYDHEIELEGGKFVWHRSTLQPRFDKDDNFLGIYALCIDISEMKHKNEELNAMLKSLVASKALYDLAPVGYFVLDSNGVLEDYNEAAKNIVEILLKNMPDKYDLYGMKLENIVLDVDKSKLTDFFENLDNNKDVLCSVEFSRVLIDNELMDFRIDGVYSSQTNKYLLMVIDLSDLRRSENDLFRERELLKLTEKLSQIASWRYDFATSQTYYSSETASVLGIPQDVCDQAMTMCNENDDFIMQTIEKQQRDKYIKYYEAVHTNALPADVEVLYTTPLGEKKWLYLYAQLVYDENDKMVSRVGFMMDITKRKMLELDMAEQEARLRFILDSLSDGLILTREDASVVRFSKSAVQMLEVEREEIIGKSILDLFPIHAREVVDLLGKRSIHSNATEREEIIYIKKSGDECVLDVSVRRVDLPQFDETLYMVALHDTTERVNMVQHLIRSERLVSLGEMATAMAHEINQPLLSISLGLDNMVDHLKNRLPDDKEYIKKKSEKMFDDVSRIGHLIDHVRDFARDQNNQGSSEMINSAFSINESINNAMTIMGEQLIQHGFVVELNLAPNLPTVFGNIYQLEQVVVNLIANAKDAINERVNRHGDTKAKSIIIESFTRDGSVAFSVLDNGCGIKKEHIEMVLHPFFSTKGSSGVGVGLSISNSIVKDLNGQIDVESDGELFTKFTVSFKIEQ